MQQLGMTSTEEVKLLAMRDYILKLANAIARLADTVDSTSALPYFFVVLRRA